MSSEIDEFSRAIGSLEATVEGFKDQWAKQDENATDGRRILHDKIDKLQNAQQATAAKVDQLATKIDEMAPVVDGVIVARHRKAGARTMLWLIWSTLAAGVTAISYVIHEWISLFFPPRH